MTAPPDASVMPRYRDGSVLTAALLQAGQMTLTAAGARHAERFHSAGVICGLDVEIGDGGVWVTAGAALVEGGSVLALPVRSAVDTSALGDASAAVVHLQAAGDAPGRGKAIAVSSTADADRGGATVTLGAVRREHGAWLASPAGRLQVGLTAAVVSNPAQTGAIRLEGAALTAMQDDRPLLRAWRRGVEAAGSVAAGCATLTQGLALAGPPRSPPGAGVALDRSQTGLCLNLPVGARLTVGVRDGGHFKVVLSLSPRGDLAVSGALEVAGRLTLPPVPADAADPRFIAALDDAIGRVPAPIVARRRL